MIQMQFPAGERREIREIREKARETKEKVVVKHNKNLPPRPWMHQRVSPPQFLRLRVQRHRRSSHLQRESV